MSGEARWLDAAGADLERYLRQLPEKRAQVVSSMPAEQLRAVIHSMRQKRVDGVELLCSGTAK